MPRNTSEARTVKVIDLLTVLISKLGPWLLAVAVAYYIRGSILAVMHEDTLAPAWMKMMSSLNQVRVFGFIFGLLGLGYGIRERELRRRAAAESVAPKTDRSEGRAESAPIPEECTR